MNLLHITTEKLADSVMGVCIAGEIDMATAEQVADAIHTVFTERPREIRHDMAAVTFMDSAGIRMLLRTRREVVEQQAELRVVNAHRRVIRILDLTGLLELFQDSTIPD